MPFSRKMIMHDHVSLVACALRIRVTLAQSGLWDSSENLVVVYDVPELKPDEHLRGTQEEF